MSRKSWPVPVLIVALLYLGVGCVGFVYHFRELSAPDGIGIEITESVAVISGVFLLLGRSWARWLAVAWIAFHVVLSAFHSLGETVIHVVFLGAIAWLLFRPGSAQFFRGTNA